MRIYKGKEITSVNFDEKCVTILEELNRHGFRTASDLYEATKPTQYPTLWKRIDEMKEAKLIKTLPGRPLDYEITGSGKKVAKLLELKELSFAEIAGEEGMDVEAAARYVGSFEKASPEQIKEFENQDRSRI